MQIIRMLASVGCAGWFAAACAGLIIRNVTTPVIQIDETGVCTFNNYYTEESAKSSSSGELRIAYNGAAKGWTTLEGAGRRTNLGGRFTPSAFLPYSGLVFRSSSSVPVASLSSEGDFFTGGGFTDGLTKPTAVDPNKFESFVYASTGVQGLDRYRTPSPGFSTGRLDITDFFKWIDPGTFGFGSNSVPINGIMRVPKDPGPRPLVLIAHGDAASSTPSELGYLYLCDVLASNGIIAASIDVNFLGDHQNTEMCARAIVLLEHLKQFRTWNLPGGSLAGRVDMSQIMLIGHSRGGESILGAAYMNGLDQVTPRTDPPTLVKLDGTYPQSGPPEIQKFGPYHFSIRCLCGVAPTDGQYTPIETNKHIEVTTNYFLIQGGRDLQIFDFEGYATYTGAHPIDPANPTMQAGGFKGLLHIQGADHGGFNTEWPADGTALITPDQQRDIAKVYIASLARGLLLGDSRYLSVVKSYKNAWAWLPQSTSYVSHYQDKKRFFYNYYDQPGDRSTVSPPAVGSNSPLNVTASVSVFATNPSTSNHVLQLGWNSTSGSYTTTFSPTLQIGNYQYLAMHLAQTGSTLNLNGANQDIGIRVRDNTGATATFLASDFAPLLYPFGLEGMYANRIVFQTIRIPLSLIALRGVNPASINEVRLLTNQSMTGELYIDEMQLSF
jgi:hypothetical protein